MVIMERKTDTIALKKYMVEKGYKTIVSLSRDCGVNRNTLGKILDGEEQPSADVMTRLVSVLDIPAGEAGTIFFSP